MGTVGWLLILIALTMLRGLAKGRTIADTPGDLGDIFVGLVSGDTAKVKEALARTGDSNVPGNPDQEISGTFTVLPSKSGGLIASNAKRLGTAAKGYRPGATGPTYYDCSGLVWRTLSLMKLYKGVRFTTQSFVAQVNPIQVNASTAQVGDIVLWVRTVPFVHHMGIVDGEGTFYSARSVKSGIGTSPIAGFNSFAPTYWRIPS